MRVLAQVGGAVKNVIAIAAGMSEGLGLGTNAMAALVTRGTVNKYLSQVEIDEFWREKKELAENP